MMGMLQRVGRVIILFASCLALAVFCSNGMAQKVRLRSQITPACASTAGDNAKFSDLFGEGNIAVLGTYGCRGAFIFDITNPDAPVLASWYNPGASVFFLEAVVIGNRGYFGSGSGTGVHIVDLTDPYHPVLLGTVDSTHGNAHNSIHEMVVFDQNGRRYLIENYNSLSVTKILKVIDVTNPSAPIFVRDITPTDPQWVHAMVVKGNRMFTSGWGNTASRGRTEIYDISNIGSQAPALLGFISDATGTTAGNNMHSAWPSEDGNYLYSARETNNGTGDIRIYNISNPASPLLVNRITTADLGLNAVTPHNPVVAGNFLYVSWYQAGVQVFNISQPANPVRVGQYDTYQPQFTPPADEGYSAGGGRAGRRERLVRSEPWDMICGGERLQNSLPSNYDGNWAVYPFLGQNKILAGDLKNGLLILDASGVTSPLRNRAADFDGDRRTDLSVLSPASGAWTIEASTDASTLASRVRLGQPGDQVVAGDYDGDGIADIGVYRPGTGEWFVRKLRARNTGYLISTQYGVGGDIPVPGDYDADGRTDVALYRPSNTTFYIWQSTLGTKTVPFAAYGAGFGDRPVTGDYDRDGKTDLALWRPSTGNWVVQQSSSSLVNIYNLGASGDIPVSGDFNGNGVTDLSVYRPSNGSWLTLDPLTMAASTLNWGSPEDLPIPADFDGDGKADLSVFRPSTGHWLRVNSSDGTIVDRAFGQPGDTPVPLSIQPQ